MRRKLALAAISALSAVSLFAATVAAYENPQEVDFGREGAEVPGQPACYVEAPDHTRKTNYNLYRPACHRHLGT
jgi:hypothetical protein